jgi:hypothetical protein
MDKKNEHHCECPFCEPELTKECMSPDFCEPCHTEHATCKHCGAALQKDVTVCPACGTAQKSGCSGGCCS